MIKDIYEKKKQERDKTAAELDRELKQDGSSLQEYIRECDLDDEDCQTLKAYLTTGTRPGDTHGTEAMRLARASHHLACPTEPGGDSLPQSMLDEAQKLLDTSEPKNKTNPRPAVTHSQQNKGNGR
jgi:hypothetical protein